MFFGTPHRGVDTASWEEHVVRLLAMSQFEAGSPTQLLHNLTIPLHQSAEEFAQRSWDMKVVNVFQEDGMAEKCPVVGSTLPSPGPLALLFTTKMIRCWKRPSPA
jgi:hypothetical protein